MEILRCMGVQKVFGKGESQVRALDGIDLSVEKGEFMAIVGASGSGKSTLLHMLGKDSVIVEETDIGSLNATDAAIFRRRKVGLKEKQKVLPHQLSGGQQQWVSIARALLPPCHPADECKAEEATGRCNACIQMKKRENKNRLQKGLHICVYSKYWKSNNQH